MLPILSLPLSTAGQNSISCNKLFTCEEQIFLFMELISRILMAVVPYHKYLEFVTQVYSQFSSMGGPRTLWSTLAQVV